MISVLVTYQVNPDFTEQNKANIAAFLEDFKQLDNSRFKYQVFVKEDGVSFVHASQYADETMQTQLLNVPSFLAFQKMRDESGLVDSPKVEVLRVVGSKGNLV